MTIRLLVGCCPFRFWLRFRHLLSYDVGRSCLVWSLGCLAISVCRLLAASSPGSSAYSMLGDSHMIGHVGW